MPAWSPNTDTLRVMSARACVLALVAACGDNAHPPDGPPATPRPDLALLPNEMVNTLAISNQIFAPGACELIDGCVGAAGSRRLLRFATVVVNNGPGDLVLGEVPAPGLSGGRFSWSACHMRHYVGNYATYQLRDGNTVLAVGHGLGFCIQDDERAVAIGPSHFNCAVEGISAGWANINGNGLPCQWIDVTNIPAGSYTLHVVVDAAGTLDDLDPTNNEWVTTVSL
jgi:hypothetical protein